MTNANSAKRVQYILKIGSLNPLYLQRMEVEKMSLHSVDIDYFFSGHFSDKIKTKNHFMCTVTSSSPQWFAKDGRKWAPTIEELMSCMDLNPAQFNLASTRTALKHSFGNGIPAMLTYHIGKTIIEEVLCMERDKNGLWVSKK